MSGLSHGFLAWEFFLVGVTSYKLTSESEHMSFVKPIDNHSYQVRIAVRSNWPQKSYSGMDDCYSEFIHPCL